MVGWWAISSWLPAYTQQLAKAEGYANAAQWGTRGALLYTGGGIPAYVMSGFVIDAIGRRKFLFFTYLGALVMTPLSYLRYALKTARDPRGMLEHESEELGLSPHLRSLLQQHVPTKVESVTADPLTA
jgi:hypothetical protein